MKYLPLLFLVFPLFANDPQIVNWSVDTNGFEMISKVITFGIVTIDSTHTAVDTTTTIEWKGSVEFSCFDADNDSMGVFININIGGDTIPVDSIWGVTTAFTGQNLKTFFTFHSIQKHWNGKIPAKVRLSLDNLLLGYNRKPKIITQPLSISAVTGSPARFKVFAVADPAPVYSWTYNGTAIPGANLPEYLIPSADSSNSGEYRVIVSNTLGSIVSDSVSLTVNRGPVITRYPVSLTATVGQSVTFNGAASGYPAPAYQWKKNGLNILGAISASFNIPSAVTGDSGLYQFTVTNDFGNTTSPAAVLTVNYGPSITIQPQSQIVSAGQSVSFMVTAAGNPAPGYQWKKNGVNISGATSASFSIPSAQRADTGTYSVVATNSVGSVISDGAVLSVNQTPCITQQPQSQTVRAGQTATFVVQATGSPAPAYQWKKNNAPILNATTGIYNVQSVWLNDTGCYAVVVTNSLGTTTSNAAKLNVDTCALFTTDSMILITGGTFQMGQTGIAIPVHTVTLSTFKMSNTLVTQREYLRVMGFNPSLLEGDLSLPVENVTWFDAALYCNFRSKLEAKDTVYTYCSIVGPPGNGCSGLQDLAIDETKNGYRLSNEAEYEYACRAGTSTDFYWGRSYPPQTAADTLAIDSNAVWFHNSNNHTLPVGSKKKNPWGFSDIVGQVWEWENDWDSTYCGCGQTDPVGPASGVHRIVRGGNWSGYVSDMDLRSSSRKGGYIPGDRSSIIGFRVVIR